MSVTLSNLGQAHERFEPYFGRPQLTDNAGPEAVRQRIASAVIGGRGAPRVTSACRAVLGVTRSTGTTHSVAASLATYGAAIAGFVTESFSGISGVAVSAAIERAQPWVRVVGKPGERAVRSIDFSQVNANAFLWSTAGVVAAAQHEPFEGARRVYATRVIDLNARGCERVITAIVDACTRFVDSHAARAAVVRTHRNGSDLMVSIHLDAGFLARGRCRAMLRELIAKTAEAARAYDPVEASEPYGPELPKTPAPIDGSPGDLLATREVARQLGVSVGTVRKLCQRGELVHVRLGKNSVRVASADLKAYIERKRTLGQP